MPGASLALFADWGACHVQKSSVTICVLPAPFRWRATRFKMLGDHAPIIISIHALRVEGDFLKIVYRAFVGYFYPRPPGGGRPRRPAPSALHSPYFYPRPPGGGRRYASMAPASSARFLSTPSGWRATCYSVGCELTILDFYPRPPGGGRHDDYTAFMYRYQISIHALRVEGDSSNFSSRLVCKDFYPRPPGGGRPPRENTQVQAEKISIHALRVEGDQSLIYSPRRAAYFYPRPPGGGRPARLYGCILISRISIHALRVEGDIGRYAVVLSRSRFLSTPSGWRAT